MSPWPPEGSACYCMVCSVYSVVMLDGALPCIAGCLHLLPFTPLLLVQCWSKNQFLQRLCGCFVRPLLITFHLLLLVQCQTISGLLQERRDGIGSADHDVGKCPHIRIAHPFHQSSKGTLFCCKGNSGSS